MVKLLRDRDGIGTVYAKQVPSEYKESPMLKDWWDIDEISQECCIFGNNHYPTILNDDLKEINIGMLNGDFDYEPSWNVDDPETETTLDEVLNTHYPPKHKSKYDMDEVEAWKDIAEEWSLRHNPDMCARALTLMTGNKWDYEILYHDVVRGRKKERQNFVYDTTKISREDLERIKMDYFNEGTEFVVKVGGKRHGTVYCYSRDEEGMKREIADELGCDPEDVTLDLEHI